MKKRVFSMIIALVMYLTPLPVTAMAVDIGNDIPGLGIGSTPGSELKGDTYYLINDGSPTTESASADYYHFYYDSDTSTLTLNNAILSQALFVPYGTTVDLIGSNQIGTEENTSTAGIQVNSGIGDTAVTITGVSSSMEYSLSTDVTWTDCTGESITGLAAGTYQVRVKATERSFVGETATVVIGSGVEKTYSLNVTVPAFAVMTYGYEQPAAPSITITNAGNSDATVSSVTVDSESFTIGGSGGSVPAAVPSVYGRSSPVWDWTQEPTQRPSP